MYNSNLLHISKCLIAVHVNLTKSVQLSPVLSLSLSLTTISLSVYVLVDAVAAKGVLEEFFFVCWMPFSASTFTCTKQSQDKRTHNGNRKQNRESVSAESTTIERVFARFFWLSSRPLMYLCATAGNHRTPPFLSPALPYQPPSINPPSIHELLQLG